MKIEVGKWYKNRMDDECKVIYRLEGGPTFPFVVIIKEDGTEMSENFTDNGCFRDDGITSPWDLCEEIPEPLKTAKETKAAEEPEEIAPDESCGPEKCNYCGKIKPRWNKSFGNIECKDCYWKRVAPLEAKEKEERANQIRQCENILQDEKRGIDRQFLDSIKMTETPKLSRRDHFAMVAFSFFLERYNFPITVSLHAVEFADNLIAELDKGKEQCGDL